MKKSDKNVHNKVRDNVIEFPKSPPPSDGGSETDVESGRDSHSISLQIGTPVETIQKIAKLENWKREERNTIDSHVGYWGPFLTEEESLELCMKNLKMILGH